MHALSRPLIRPRPRSTAAWWRLGLCLLLPLAQLAASWHALSHIGPAAAIAAPSTAVAGAVPSDDGGSDPSRRLHGDVCELCLAGWVLSAGAPLPPAATVPLVPLRHVDAPAAAVAWAPGAPREPCRNRGPPFFLA